MKEIASGQVCNSVTVPWLSNNMSADHEDVHDPVKKSKPKQTKSGEEEQLKHAESLKHPGTSVWSLSLFSEKFSRDNPTGAAGFPLVVEMIPLLLLCSLSLSFAQDVSIFARGPTESSPF
ncbi:hypothetical protein F7725_014998 [Dissostichus mawsoni]|uniref:Uncharacterized protein n=1 Tax=Dissostichus mawsoni TaxID=36200 RepID=A0A7J5YHR4_DISMA|nr:hypothetical protein F7725_014998 [Dissostichus mawsoni]